MSDFQRYPHLNNLHKVPEIFACEEVVATEKIHGSNFRIFIPGTALSTADVKFGSRNNVVGLGGDARWNLPIQWFLAGGRLDHIVHIAERLYGTDDMTIYGEVFGSGVQKGITYVTGDEVMFRAFDVLVGDRFLDYDDFLATCLACGIPTVPEVYRGKPTVEALNALLEVNSITAVHNGVTLEPNTAEGLVI